MVVFRFAPGRPFGRARGAQAPNRVSSIGAPGFLKIFLHLQASSSPFQSSSEVHVANDDLRRAFEKTIVAIAGTAVAANNANQRALPNFLKTRGFV